MNAKQEYINSQKLIKEGDSKFLKGLPGLIIVLIKIIIKEKEINRILSAYADYEGVEFLPKIISGSNIKVEIEGKENLPENGRCFFVANHPFGFVDGLILTNIVARKYGCLKAIGKEVFLFVPHIKTIVAAVNVFGTNPRRYLLEIEKVFASDVPITHFPAGLVSRVRRGKIEDSNWQKSFIMTSMRR